MRKIIQLRLQPDIAYEPKRLHEFMLRKLKLQPDNKLEIKKLKQSIDARKNKVIVNLTVEAYIDENRPSLTFMKVNKEVSQRPVVLIIGAGPAGLFAALKLIELGLKPVIIERGKDVRSRRRDIAHINQKHIVNVNSNYCFGEGGAGTYSDGKLYTRAKKRGSVLKILETLVAHGADEGILYESRPHIGTNKLPQIISAIRATILQCGGEIHFEHRLIDFSVKNKALKEIVVENGEGRKLSFSGIGVILATGHSARDIFHLLHQNKISITAKPFALGVRVEHDQSLIDSIQYHCSDRGLLPAASYTLVHRYNDRGVFSFCMCPGGFIVPSATAPGEVVVNGMSPSKRNSKYANSGIVVEVHEGDWKKYEKEWGPLSAMVFQQEIEQKACKWAGGTQVAPAQLLTDFIKGTVSAHLRDTSYQPGVSSVDFNALFPSFISKTLKAGFKDFGAKMKGYITSSAQIIGVESRTSSPVRIPRNPENCEHPEIKGLYPCGEGAGYAGGIMSAALDGERCALGVFENAKKS